MQYSGLGSRNAEMSGSEVSAGEEHSICGRVACSIPASVPEMAEVLRWSAMALLVGFVALWRHNSGLLSWLRTYRYVDNTGAEEHRSVPIRSTGTE